MGPNHLNQSRRILTAWMSSGALHRLSHGSFVFVWNQRREEKKVVLSCAIWVEVHTVIKDLTNWLEITLWDKVFPLVTERRNFRYDHRYPLFVLFMWTSHKSQSITAQHGRFNPEHKQHHPSAPKSTQTHRWRERAKTIDLLNHYNIILNSNLKVHTRMCSNTAVSSKMFL